MFLQQRFNMRLPQNVTSTSTALSAEAQQCRERHTD
jgi:hypothetical protein